MASSRFPGKPLERMLGMPLILHVMHRCTLEENFDDVIVATCDPEIMKCVENANGVAVMTASTHDRCTDRVFEAIEAYPTKLQNNDLIVMVQGDEVLVNPDMLKNMILLLRWQIFYLQTDIIQIYLKMHIMSQMQKILLI